MALKLSKKSNQKQKQNAKLKLANRQKDEIISAISHEFKNPIAIISGYAQTILEDEDLPKQMKDRFLEKIYLSSNKLSHLIDRLRLSFRLDEKRDIAILKKVFLSEICKSVIDDLKISYENREIELVISDDIEFEIDEALMSVAISNLIENALKYSEKNIVVKLEKDCIKVIDKGVGLDEKEIEKITNKFYRVNKNSWNNSLGLGLNIVLNILKMHNFKLKIESKLEKGSTFSIEF